MVITVQACPPTQSLSKTSSWLRVSISVALKQLSVLDFSSSEVMFFAPSLSPQRPLNQLSRRRKTKQTSHLKCFPLGSRGVRHTHSDVSQTGASVAREAPTVLRLQSDLSEV